MPVARAGTGWANGAAAVIATTVTAAQSLALAALAGFYAVELSRGAGDDRTRVLMSMVLMLGFAGGLGALARALWHRSEAARTPTIVWDALLLPVGWSLVQSGQAALGAVVLASAVVAVGAVLAGRPRG